MSNEKQQNGSGWAEPPEEFQMDTVTGPPIRSEKDIFNEGLEAGLAVAFQIAGCYAAGQNLTAAYRSVDTARARLTR